MKKQSAHHFLVQQAMDVRRHAYAPYSKFRVGAAIECEDGAVYCGVNVENCSYGLTVCAERNAIAAALAHGVKPGTLRKIAIVADSQTMVPPCGACRQVLLEFARPATQVILYNLRNRKQTTTTIKRLLPNAFFTKHLT